MEQVGQPEWSDLIVDTHIVIAVFYKEHHPDSKKMLDLLEKQFCADVTQFDDTKLVKVNAKENPDLVEELNIEELPVVMIFHHSEPVTHLVKNIKSQHIKVNKVIHSYKKLPNELFALLNDLHRMANK